MSKNFHIDWFFISFISTTKQMTICRKTIPIFIYSIRYWKTNAFSKITVLILQPHIITITILILQ